MSTITLAEVLDRTDLIAVLLPTKLPQRRVDVDGTGPRPRTVVSSAAARRVRHLTGVEPTIVTVPDEPVESEDIADTIANLFGGDVNVKNLLVPRNVAPQTVHDLLPQPPRKVSSEKLYMFTKTKPLLPVRKRELSDAERRSKIAALLDITDIDLKGSD